MEREISQREISKIASRPKVPNLIRQCTLRGTLLSQRLLNRKIHKGFKSSASNVPILSRKSEGVRADTMRENSSKNLEVKNTGMNSRPATKTVSMSYIPTNSHQRRASSNSHKVDIENMKTYARTNQFYINMGRLERQLTLFYDSHLTWNKS